MKATAKIIPMTKTDTSIPRQHKLFGIWSDHDDAENVNRYVRDLREGRSHDN